MRLYLDRIGLLEVFAEAQGLGRSRELALKAEVLAGAFVVPQVGKSGLSRPKNLTDVERREKRAEIARRQYAAAMADPLKAERVRELRRERVRRFRARKAAEGSR